MEDSQELLDAICDIFEEVGEEFINAGALAAHLTRKFAIKPAMSATRLIPIMQDLGIEVEIMKRGNRPTQGYTAADCLDARDLEDRVMKDPSILEAKPDPPKVSDTRDIDMDILKVYATELMSWIASIEPLWKSRINALKDERGFDDLLALASLVGWTLDNEGHMIVPSAPIFDAVQWNPGSKTCPICGTGYNEAYPGQATCGAYQCGKTYNASKREMVA